MPDQPSLANQTLERLRAYARGNGLADEAIQIVSCKEETYPLEGLLTLSPSFEKESITRQGKAKSAHGVTLLPSFSALEEETARQRDSFEKDGTWLDRAIQEIEKETGHGWGLEEGEVSWPGQLSILAASEACIACNGSGQNTCPHCHGARTVPCIECQATGQEMCPQCQGRGEDPAHPNQPCPICNGKRLIICRFCGGQGKVPCPQCQGKGGTTCQRCNGAGSMTQEIKIKRGAKVNFALGSTNEFPSGLLRLMTRIGLANLPRGHIDVTVSRAPPGPQIAQEANVLRLTAQALYAEITLRIGKNEQIIYAFGKRGYLSNVPPFLDRSLLPARKKLLEAAKGQRPPSHAMGARAVRDALSLALGGRTQPNDLRRLYPIGLSANVAQEIMKNGKALLRNMTQKFRALTGGALWAGSLVIFAAFYLSPLPTYLTAQVGLRTAHLVEAFLPAIVLGAEWFILQHATRWELQRRFPKCAVAQTQTIGKIGLGTIGASLVTYLLLWNHFAL